jgi:pimeloyl-ACP methyl ester carboxylesterase
MIKSAQKTYALGVRYQTVMLGKLEIFYREAGDPGKPTLLLLHGFPSSSHMFRNLFQQLSDDYHLIAPDYPGFGYSACPDPSLFDYSFDHLAVIMEQFIDELKMRDISFYMQDYGGPIGFRIIQKRPELVKCLIIQNANVFLEGLGPDVLKIGALTEANDVAGLDAAIENMMSLEGIKSQYVFGSSQPEIISPDSYHLDHFFIKYYLPTIAAISPAILNGRLIFANIIRRCSSPGVKTIPFFPVRVPWLIKGYFQMQSCTYLKAAISCSKNMEKR